MSRVRRFSDRRFHAHIGKLTVFTTFMMTSVASNGDLPVGCAGAVPMTSRTSGHEIMKSESLFAGMPVERLRSEAWRVIVEAGCVHATTSTSPCQEAFP